MKHHFFSFILLLITATAFAGQVTVPTVQVKSLGEHKYRFDVTLQHADKDWEHYANRWEILDTQGNILATRMLHHPHVNEQPFTRSLTTELPEHIKTVIVRGHDSVHQYGSKEVTVTLPQ